MNARVAVASVLRAVMDDGRSLSTSLPEALAKVGNQERGLVQEIVYGTLRHYWTLNFFLTKLLEKPLKAKDSDVRCLLLAGLYQLSYMRIPEHAAVNETVKSVALLKKDWAKNLVNGVLRAFLRQKEPLRELSTQKETSLYSHPAWIIDKLKRDWPESYAEILLENNQYPPMTIRVNARKTTREQYLADLTAVGIEARALSFAPHAIGLNEAVDVNKLPNFAQGFVSVQDEAAQMASTLLDLHPGQRVLDACCAPGGKTGAILELAPAVAEVVALDVDEARLARVRENLARLGLSANLLCADAQDLATWWDGRLFDRILLDAPCSGTGVIRRNPDIKHLRTADDIVQLAAKQELMLTALWQTLAPGGLLLYATCSVFKAENEERIASFVRNTVDAQHEALSGTWGQTRPYGRQVLPGQDGMDGFYYALLRKK